MRPILRSLILMQVLLLATSLSNSDTERRYQSPKGYESSDYQSLSKQFDPEFMKDSQSINYDDPAEVQMAYLMCGLQGFDGSDCKKVLKVCLKQKAMLVEAIKKGKKYKPWLCEDMRFIKEFL